MSRYIDADAAKKDADERGFDYWSSETDIKNAKEFIDAQDTADVEEVRHGEWQVEMEDWLKWTCPFCEWSKRTDIHVALGYKRCPECGAKMDGGK